MTVAARVSTKFDHEFYEEVLFLGQRFFSRHMLTDAARCFSTAAALRSSSTSDVDIVLQDREYRHLYRQILESVGDLGGSRDGVEVEENRDVAIMTRTSYLGSFKSSLSGQTIFRLDLYQTRKLLITVFDTLPNPTPRGEYIELCDELQLVLDGTSNPFSIPSSTDRHEVSPVPLSEFDKLEPIPNTTTSPWYGLAQNHRRYRPSEMPHSTRAKQYYDMLRQKYCPPLDESLFIVLAGDYNLEQHSSRKDFEETLDGLKREAIIEQELEVTPSKEVVNLQTIEKKRPIQAPSHSGTIDEDENIYSVVVNDLSHPGISADTTYSDSESQSETDSITEEPPNHATQETVGTAEPMTTKAPKPISKSQLKMRDRGYHASEVGKDRPRRHASTAIDPYLYPDDRDELNPNRAWAEVYKSRYQIGDRKPRDLEWSHRRDDVSAKIAKAGVQSGATKTMYSGTSAGLEKESELPMELPQTDPLRHLSQLMKRFIAMGSYQDCYYFCASNPRIFEEDIVSLRHVAYKYVCQGQRDTAASIIERWYMLRHSAIQGSEGGLEWMNVLSTNMESQRKLQRECESVLRMLQGETMSDTNRPTDNATRAEEEVVQVKRGLGSQFASSPPDKPTISFWREV